MAISGYEVPKKSVCPRSPCASTEFEKAVIEIKGVHGARNVVQCAKCGAVITVVP
jgi:uncharacterized Zn finger protein